MSIYSNSIRQATSWAKSRLDGIEGWPRYIISIGIWSIAILSRLSQFWGRELLSPGPVGRASLGTSFGL